MPVAAQSVAQTPAQADLPTPQRIAYLGLHARAFAETRDADLKQMAAMIEDLAARDKDRLRQLQRSFEDAFMFVCDREVYDTLAPETIRAVSKAIASAVTYDDLARGTTWDSLAYAWGYFHRDVTPEAIQKVRDDWESIPDGQREPIYPYYVHLIDVVCKPLSMGALASDEATSRALAIAIPMLIPMLAQPPKAGYAFHPPSHASIILAPLYDRWADSAKFGPLVRRELGDREAFIKLETDQLLSRHADPRNLSPMEYRFFYVSNLYVANALARLDAREAVAALRETLAIGEEKRAPRNFINYMQRALVTLGDETLRRQVESLALLGDSSRAPAIETLAWVCRNGRGEALEYGRRMLGRALDCAPERALQVYFEGRLHEAERAMRDGDGRP
jgi:hypothetical protein